MIRRLALIPCSDINEGRRRAIQLIKEQWNEPDVDSTSLEIINNVNDLFRESLFDDNIMVYQNTDKDSLEIILNELSVRTGASLDDYIGSGLIIITTVLTTTTVVKELVNQVKKLKGTALSDRTVKIENLLNETSLNPDVLRQLKEYAGTDETIVIPIVNEIKTMPDDIQSRLNWDDVRIRIPTQPGTIPPWSMGFGRNAEPGVDDYIIDNNTAGAISKIQRVLDGGMSPLSITAWLKKSFNEMLTLYAMIYDDGIDRSEAAAMLGLSDPKYSCKGMKDPNTKKSGYPTLKKIETARRIGRPRLIKMLHEINNAEYLLKSGSMKCKLKPMNVMIRMVINICD